MACSSNNPLFYYLILAIWACDSLHTLAKLAVTGSSEPCIARLRSLIR